MQHFLIIINSVNNFIKKLIKYAKNHFHIRFELILVMIKKINCKF